jgi:hypothetical protein
MARDNVGHEESLRTNADTFTYVTDNKAPTLAPVFENIFVRNGTYIVTNTASDPDAGQVLTYNLKGASPLGAVINPTNGIFKWHPSRSYAGTTNTITIEVSDNGYPNLTATQTFVIIVPQLIEGSIGSSILLAGNGTNIPVTLFSSEAITNPVFELVYPAERLSDFYLTNFANGISGSISNESPTSCRVFLTNVPGLFIKGQQQVVSFGFTAVSDQHSAFVPLTLTDLNANHVSDGSLAFSVSDGEGRLTIIGPEPLLEGWLIKAGQCNITIYGHPGRIYKLEGSEMIFPAFNWKETDISVSLTNLYQNIVLPTKTNDFFYYRAEQQ